jgi:hypothetical protein
MILRISEYTETFKNETSEEAIRNRILRLTSIYIGKNTSRCGRSETANVNDETLAEIGALPLGLFMNVREGNILLSVHKFQYNNTEVPMALVLFSWRLNGVVFFRINAVGKEIYISEVVLTLLIIKLIVGIVLFILYLNPTAIMVIVVLIYAIRFCMQARDSDFLKEKVAEYISYFEKYMAQNDFNL